MNNNTIEFNRSKIFEKLKYKPEPENYSSNVSWVVQNQIAATNGIHYIDRIGKLKEYPIYELPVPKPHTDNLMLDIGSGWGRWLVAGANKGYIPVGLDIRLEFCETQQNVLKDLNKKGYSIVGDLENLPFANSVFDLVWSFSVIQHTHYDRLINCLKCIDLILAKSGYTYLEFPNKDGLRNRFGPVISQAKFKDDYNNWCVRYYTPDEYKDIFNKYLTNFAYNNHSFLGIGVLKEDIKYVSAKNKIPCIASLILSYMTNIIPPLKQISDSIYIKAEKKTATLPNKSVGEFIHVHNNSEFDNLNIVPLLKCPKYGTSLRLNAERTRLISDEAGVYYPVINNIPILIASEAVSV